MSLLHRIAIAIPLLTLASCSGPVDKVFSSDVQSTLASPDRFEFLTIDPSHDNFDPARPGTMHGYAILGSTLITDSTVQKRLVSEVYDAVHYDESAPVAGCFNPRHALRVTRGGKTVDVVICFECGSLEVYSDGPTTRSLINGNAAGDFEAIARQASLPVATRP